MKTSQILVRSLIPLIIGMTSFPGQRATAATFIVTETKDTLKGDSLRAAIIAANHSVDRFNTILLEQPRGYRRNDPQDCVFRLTITGANEGAARTGDLNITRGNLIITGVGSNIIIDATGLGDRVFQVFPKVHLTLVNLTIRGGVGTQARPGDYYYYSYIPALPAGSGGAIYNAGQLTLESCIITNNSSGAGSLGSDDWSPGLDAADGGGIYNSGAMSATRCAIVGNTTGFGVNASSNGNGGGLLNCGTCVLADCVIGGNQCGIGGTDYFPNSGAGDGGGICNEGTASLERCVISNNVAGIGYGPDWGGNGLPGGNGGGIFNSGTITLNECITVENLAGQGAVGEDMIIGGPGGTGGLGGSGGGICNNGRMNVAFSAIYGNSSGNGGDGDRSGLIGITGGSGETPAMEEESITPAN